MQSLKTVKKFCSTIYLTKKKKKSFSRTGASQIFCCWNMPFSAQHCQEETSLQENPVASEG